MIFTSFVSLLAPRSTDRPSRWMMESGAIFRDEIYWWILDNYEGDDTHNAQYL